MRVAMWSPCSVIGIALIVLGLGSPQAVGAQTVESSQPTESPPSELSSVWPEEAGIDSTKLVELSTWIRDNKYDVRSLVIVKSGRIVFERYSAGLNRDNTYEMYSITKAATAMLAGQLIAEGRISLDSTVRDVIGKWRPDLAQAVADKGGITLRHVLSMTTGLRYDFKPPNDPIYYESPDRLKLAATTTLALMPGKVFQYMDVNPIIATAMLSAAAGRRIEDYAAERLFEPLGMRRYAWSRADRTGLVSGGWGLRLRAIDMARLGMLALQGGRWKGSQIVPADWIAQMTRGQSTPFFGYYWWVNNIVEGGVEGDTQREFDTMGFKGQNVVVLPEHDAVVTMTAMLPVAGGLRDAACLQIMRYMMSRYILPALGGRPSPPSDATKRALTVELRAAEDSHGIQGVDADPTDAPQ